MPILGILLVALWIGVIVPSSVVILDHGINLLFVGFVGLAGAICSIVIAVVHRFAQRHAQGGVLVSGGRVAPKQDVRARWNVRILASIALFVPTIAMGLIAWFAAEPILLAPGLVVGLLGAGLWLLAWRSQRERMEASGFRW